jgi:hypothetical protein
MRDTLFRPHERNITIHFYDFDFGQVINIVFIYLLLLNGYTGLMVLPLNLASLILPVTWVFRETYPLRDLSTQFFFLRLFALPRRTFKLRPITAIKCSDPSDLC